MTSRTDDLVIVQGLRGTRATIETWNDRPWRTVGPWFAGSFAIAGVLLLCVLLVAARSTPSTESFALPGFDGRTPWEQVRFYLHRNGLVLALHAMACVAGFIAMSSLPAEAERYSGAWRWIHDRAGRLALAFVAGATLFSLGTQAAVIGFGLKTQAWDNGVSAPYLLLLLLPHAVPELVALFLPLAAWIIASRHREWDTLLAVTFVTVALAVPMIVVAALIEAFVTPILLGHALGL